MIKSLITLDASKASQVTNIPALKKGSKKIKEQLHTYKYLKKHITNIHQRISFNKLQNLWNHFLQKLQCAYFKKMDVVVGCKSAVVAEVL